METGLLVALRVSKEGYGSLQQVMEMRADLVLSALEYILFRQVYEETAHELNREKK